MSSAEVSRPFLIKVCGMTQAENIRAVEALGVDWMGFIFYPRSPRFIDQCPSYLPTQARRVGVFVNASLEEISRRIHQFGLQSVQLHGDEEPAFCRKVGNLGVEVIKAFSIRSEADIEATQTYEGRCHYLLFDTPTAGRGGSGVAFDWRLLSTYRGQTPFLLSGGISPESVEALRLFSHPQWAGIDLNSRFESAPGVKSIPLLAPFIQEVRKLKGPVLT